MPDHQRTGSWENEATRTRAYATGPVKVEPTRKTTSTRIQNLLERKANKMLMKMEQSTGISLKKSTNVDHNAHVDMIADKDQELDKYLVLLLGLQRTF